MSTMPDIPGFDVTLALRQLGNNVKLYNKLLDQFQKSYAPSAADIAASVSSDDWETAERNTHTIKGLAGSLGAKALQEASAKLEKLCRERVSDGEYDDTLAAFAREMDSAIASIRSYMAESGAAPGVNTAYLASHLGPLAANINDSDVKAIMLFEEIKPQLAAYDQQATSRIASALENFDFSSAAETIAALRARLS